jgi:hypothetical protein
MPYRDRAQVESWLSDFWDTHSLFAEEVSVVDDSFVPGTNSGIVVVTLAHAGGVAFLSVTLVNDSPVWTVTLEPRTEEIRLDRTGIANLAGEIGALGLLCEYLQMRTDDAIRHT